MFVFFLNSKIVVFSWDYSCIFGVFLNGKIVGFSWDHSCLGFFFSAKLLVKVEITFVSFVFFYSKIVGFSWKSRPKNSHAWLKKTAPSTTPVVVSQLGCTHTAFLKVPTVCPACCSAGFTTNVSYLARRPSLPACLCCPWQGLINTCFWTPCPRPCSTSSWLTGSTSLWMIGSTSSWLIGSTLWLIGSISLWPIGSTSLWLIGSNSLWLIGSTSLWMIGSTSWQTGSTLWLIGSISLWLTVDGVCRLCSNLWCWCSCPCLLWYRSVGVFLWAVGWTFCLMSCGLAVSWTFCLMSCGLAVSWTFCLMSCGLAVSWTFCLMSCGLAVSWTFCLMSCGLAVSWTFCLMSCGLAVGCCTVPWACHDFLHVVVELLHHFF